MKLFYNIVFALLIVLILTSCSMKVTGVSNYTETQKEYLIIKYWTDAQEELEDKTNNLSALVPHIVVDQWVWSSQRLKYKKEVFAYGTMTVDRINGLVITIVEWRPWTIRHEACHAILYYLQYPDWETYCHKTEAFR